MCKNQKILLQHDSGSSPQPATKQMKTSLISNETFSVAPDFIVPSFVPAVCSGNQTNQTELRVECVACMFGGAFAPDPMCRIQTNFEFIARH